MKELDVWTAELDRRYEVDIVYIDFQKTFDSVPHKKLLSTISKYGIKGKTLNWITAFLTDRTQQVVVSERPILFLLFNSMTDGITSHASIRR